MPGNDDNKDTRRNPWGRPSPDDKSPWGAKDGSGPRDPRDTGNDFENLLRHARDRFTGQGEGRHALALAIIALVIWLGSGLYRLDSSDNAIIQRFGAYTRTVAQPGLGYHMPWPIETMTKLNTTLDRRVQIGFTDQGFAGSQRQNVDAESLMLTADANIVDINVVVLWNVAEAEKFVFNIRDPELTIKRVAGSAIRDIVAQTTLQSIITQGRGDVGMRIQKLLQSVLDSYQSGVAIKQVLIQGATVHPEVLEAYNDVAASRQDAARFQNEATIYRNDILPKARGEAIKMQQDALAYKEQVISKAQGDAQRFAQILEASKTGKDVVRTQFYVETMQDVLGSANRIIIDPKDGTNGPVTVLPLDTLKTATPEEAK